MKNLKIGSKILLGFGTAIAMMLVIAAVVLITNLRSISNVKTIDLDSTLQTSTRHVLDSFNAAHEDNTLIF